MTKPYKKRMIASRDRGERILTILNNKKGTADVAEFINTIKFVVSVVEDFLAAKDKERPKIADEGVKIEELLKSYEDLLTQLAANNTQFLRLFTSNRVRKNLDQINSQIHKEVSEIFVGMQENRRKSTKKKKAMKAEKELAQVTECIKDEDGKTFWEAAFSQNLMVDWNDFIRQLNGVIQVSDDANDQLRYILDNSNTGFISVYKFADFLEGFGPLKQCIEKVEEVLNAEWFHGFLSSGEADRFLAAQPPGTYLIRFSKSKPGSFAIAYVDSNNRSSVTHTLIQSSPPSGFKIEEAYNRNARGRLFVTLSQVVHFYSYILKTPFQSDLPRQSWFHGDLSAQEAEEILTGHQEGTFLFRFSSKPGFLAVSYVKSGAVKHGVLETVPGGYKFENTPPIYPTLPDVVLNLRDMLHNPLTALTFNVSGNRPSTTRSSAPAATSDDSNYHPLGPAVFAAQPTTTWAASQPGGRSLGQSSGAMHSSNGGLNGSNGSSNGDGYGHPNGQPSANAHAQKNAHPTNGYPGFSPNGMSNGHPSAMHSPNTPTHGYAPVDEFSGMSPANNRSMPQKQPDDYGSMPAEDSGENLSDYGSMPIISASGSTSIPNQSRAPPSNYGGSPASQSPQSNYNSMPVPGGTISRASVMGHPGLPKSEYGSMDAFQNTTPLARSMGTPTPMGNPNSMGTPKLSGEYGSMQGVSTRPTSMQNPAVAPSGPHQEYTSMPLGITKTPSQQGMRTPPAQTAAQNRLSTQVPPPGSDPGNYSKLPVTRSGSGLGIPNSTPPATPTTPNVPMGNMGNNQPQGNYGSISSLARAKTPTPVTSPPSRPLSTMQQSSTPPGNYGSLPNVRASVKAAPIDPQANAQYGKIPMIPTNRGSHPTVTSPTGPRAAPTAPMGTGNPMGMGNPTSTAQPNYGAIPVPRSKISSPMSSPNPGNSGISSPGIPENYGVIPQRSTISAKSPAVPTSHYGAVPVVTRNSPAVGRPMGSPGVPMGNNHPTSPPSVPMGAGPNSNYGHIPQIKSMMGRPMAGVESDYGGLPSQGSSGNLLEESDYGGLPPAEQGDGSDYGGLPSTAMLMQMAQMSMQSQESDYGGLPTAQHLTNHMQPESDYGGLPVVR